MNRRRALLCALVLYVALDLSLPAMPGAFVFEPSESVESAQSFRGRGAGDVAAPVLLAESALVEPRRPVAADSSDAAAETEAPRPVVRRLPRTTPDQPSAAEDPH